MRRGVSAFARALVAVALKRGRLEKALEALSRAADLLASPDGRRAVRFLQSARFPRAEREKLLDELSKGLAMPPELRASLELLARGRLLGKLAGVAKQARLFAEKVGDRALARVESAAPLTPKAERRLAAALGKVAGRPVDLEVGENPSLLAGMVVRLGSQRWDASLAGRLRRAGEALVRGR